MAQILTIGAAAFKVHECLFVRFWCPLFQGAMQTVCRQFVDIVKQIICTFVIEQHETFRIVCSFVIMSHTYMLLQKMVGFFCIHNLQHFDIHA